MATSARDNFQITLLKFQRASYYFLTENYNKSQLNCSIKQEHLNTRRKKYQSFIEKYLLCHICENRIYFSARSRIIYSKDFRAFLQSLQANVDCTAKSPRHLPSESFSILSFINHRSIRRYTYSFLFWQTRTEYSSITLRSFRYWDNCKQVSISGKAKPTDGNYLGTCPDTPHSCCGTFLSNGYQCCSIRTEGEADSLPPTRTDVQNEPSLLPCHPYSSTARCLLAESTWSTFTWTISEEQIYSRRRAKLYLFLVSLTPISIIQFIASKDWMISEQRIVKDVKGIGWGLIWSIILVYA
jgi:hypothetical protein